MKTKIVILAAIVSVVFASWQENIKPRTRKNGIVFMLQNYNVCAEN